MDKPIFPNHRTQYDIDAIIKYLLSYDGKEFVRKARAGEGLHRAEITKPNGKKMTILWIHLYELREGLLVGEEHSLWFNQYCQ